jgi:tetratricopeptide (TPR) repeat protein
MFGVGLILASSLHHLFVKNPAIKFTIGCLIVLTYSGLTNARTTVWGNEIFLWKDAYVQSPEKPRVNSNLGYAYLRINELDSAQKYLEQAIYYAPHHIDALDGLGVCYLKKRKYKMAHYYFKTVLQLLPDHIPAQLHLYELFLKQKKYQRCIPPLKKLRKLEPNKAGHVVKLYKIYQKNKLKKQAKALIDKFLRSHPNHKEILSLRGEKKKEKKPSKY